MVITTENPLQLGVGAAVKLKNQPHSPTMTIAGIQRGRHEGMNAVFTIATLHWFEEGGELKGMQTEIGALESA